MKEQRIIFQERLTDLKAYASEQKNVMTREEIRDFFQGAPLEESHFSMIFEYLKSQGIQVADSAQEAEEARDSGNEGSLAFYLADLEKAGCLAHLDAAGESVLPPEEELALFLQTAGGDVASRDRLAELYLPVVCGIAEEYDGGEIPVEDLIQEGNLGLLTALAALPEAESLAACQAHLLNGINKAMKEAIEESRGEQARGKAIADKVNHLSDAVASLEEELEHKVSVDELSAYLEMPAEEIRDILRMAGDGIDIEGKQ